MSAKNRKNPLLRALPLLCICLAAALGIYALDNYLRDLITRNRHLPVIELAAEVLPLEHDNDLPADRISINLPGYFGTEAATDVFRARLGAQPVGLIFSPVRARGYNGVMELAIGVRYDGTLAGVRVLEHRETPGLGDQIHQDNTPWILGFNDLSLDNTPKDAWAVQKEGGSFDHISGATSSQRAVIHAVEFTLNQYRANRDVLFRSGTRPVSRAVSPLRR